MATEYGTSRNWTSGDSRFSQGGSTTNRFWKPSRQLISGILGQTQALAGRPMSYYPGQTEAATSPYTQSGIQALGSFQPSGMGTLGGAENLLGATIRGDFLNSNPWLDATYQRGADALRSEYLTSAMPHLESRFGGSGAGGSQAYMAALGRSQGELGGSLSDLATSVYGGAYETERGRQMEAAGMSPGIVQSMNALRLMGSEANIRGGALAQGEEQRFIDADVARHNYEQMEPWQRLMMASNIAYGGGPVVRGTNYAQSGTSSNSTTGTAVNPLVEGGGGQQDPLQFWMGMLGSLLG